MTRGSITAEGIVKSYGTARSSRTTVLHGVSLSIGAGSFCSILGPSGSGKSTLMRCLAGLETIDSGSATVSGIEVHELGARATSDFRREEIGFVFQEYNLISDLTLEENIGLDRRVTRVTLDLAREWGIGEVLGHFPAQCSGGQQQKAAILRSLNKNCAVLFCDEPTGALDSRSAESVLQTLRSASEAGVTVVMVTHNELVTQISSQVVRLHNGQVETSDQVARPLRVSEVAW